MESNEPIRTDASTIHRSVMSDSSVSSPEASASDSLEAAKTVIRGSSSGRQSPQSFDAVDRTPTAVAKVLLGQRLNHFLLEDLIGGGGMGAVFRARDEQLDRVVAIKVIPFVSEYPDLQRRFRNEAQSAAKLDHPNIARVFDVGSHDDWHYIVFEYISGVNIRDQVHRDGPQSIDDAIYYTCQLADAIHHAAERGIVHRDIKPSNVLISDDDQVKLVDMGLARSENLELSEDMTASGVTLGTFDYISPEQARDPRDADVRSDIYSLGCTLYFMLTGRPPYPGGTMLQKLLSHGNSPAPDPRVLRAEVSDDLTAIIHKMLAKSPDQRYQSARDLIADLKELASRENLTRAEALGVVPASAPSQSLQWIEQHLPWMMAAAILLVSTLWLQLVTVASRDDLLLVAPTSALTSTTNSSLDRQPTLIPSPSAAGSNDTAKPANAALIESTGLEPRVVDPAMPFDLEMQPSTTTVPASDAASPPKLANLPIPRELLEGDRTKAPSTNPSAAEATETSLVPGSISSDTMSPPISAVAPRVIRVIGADSSDAIAPSESGVAVTTSLAEALRWSEQYELNTIELATPIVVTEPITIDRDAMVIRSTVGGTIIKFESGETISMQRSRMMTIGANRIELQGLHLQWVVASGEVDGGSLISMNDNKLVRLSDCTITVENPNRREEVYAFDVITDPEAIPRRRRSDVTSPSGSLPLVAIELANVIVRGEMTMIHMDFAVELQLQWDNGLLAVSRRMIDTAGALAEPTATAGPIQLSINRLTAYVPRGLVRMRLGVSGAYPVMIDREARTSVFEVDPGVPHFEITGLASIADDASLVRLRGEANAYDAETTLSDPVLAFSDRTGTKRTIRMNDILAQSYNWEDERSPRWAVRWSRQELPGLPPSRFSPSDFRQDGTVLSGFEERELPKLPAMVESDSSPPASAAGAASAALPTTEMPVTTGPSGSTESLGGTTNPVIPATSNIR